MTTYYACFDPAMPAPQPVLRWIDTATEPPVEGMPAAAGMLEITEQQWKAGMASPAMWAVDNAVLVPFQVPRVALTPGQQAQQALTRPVAVRCRSRMVLNGNYDIDPVSFGRMNRAILTLDPEAASSLDWPDTDHVLHEWPSAQFIAFVTRVASYLTDLQAIVDTDQGSLPSAMFVIP